MVLKVLEKAYVAAKLYGKTRKHLKIIIHVSKTQL